MDVIAFIKFLKKVVGFLVLLLHPLIFTLILSASMPSIPEKTLFVFSAPDDPFLYFLPSILQSKMPYLLCLSSGYIDESIQSARFFNICQKIGNVNCIFDSNFTSKGPNWNTKEIKDIIIQYVEQINPQRIFTFGIDNEFGNNIHNAQISRALSYPSIHIGQIPIQKLSDKSLKYQNSTKQDTSFFLHDKDDKLNTPIYFLKSTPSLLKYSSFFSPLIYTFTNSIQKGIFVITPPNELFTFQIRYSFINSGKYNSWGNVFNTIFCRFYYFNHFLQQHLASIDT